MRQRLLAAGEFVQRQSAGKLAGHELQEPLGRGPRIEQPLAHECDEVGKLGVAQIKRPGNERIEFLVSGATGVRRLRGSFLGERHSSVRRWEQPGIKL